MLQKKGGVVKEQVTSATQPKVIGSAKCCQLHIVSNVLNLDSDNLVQLTLGDGKILGSFFFCLCRISCFIFSLRKLAVSCRKSQV